MEQLVDFENEQFTINGKLLNKKGFSMVEIIATVAILGVISTIAVFSVTNIIERGKQEHYESTEKTIKMSAESYVQANRKYLPKNVGDKKQIYLKQLECFYSSQ